MATIDWSPSVDDVASYLRARTKDDNMTEAGTFTPDTRPTYNQVVQLVEAATDDLVGLLGVAVVPAAQEDQARRLAALGAALLIELTYFPEQVSTGYSPYEQLKTLYDQRLTTLTASTADDVSSGSTAGTQTATFAFPVEPFAATSPW